jgi:hypothetical protein
MSCPGVKRVVSFEGRPEVVNESIIGFLMEQGGVGGTVRVGVMFEQAKKFASIADHLTDRANSRATKRERSN